MPSQMPSSFASAAAGQGSSRDSRSGRGDGRGSGEWGRNSRTNGIATLRRSSTQPLDKSLSADSVQTPTSEAQASHSTSHYDHAASSRYEKSQLLDIYKTRNGVSSNRDVAGLFAENWDPGHTNDANGRGWGIHDGRDTHGPDVCWESHGGVQPIGLEEMTESERTIFNGDVNSPLKPPPQNSNKDSNGQGLGANGRKTSVSHGQGSNNFGLSSPVSSRPVTRRQQTGDSITGLGSPAGTGRFSRDDASPFFARKPIDTKDGADDRGDDSKFNMPFGSVMRANTGGNTIGNGPASPWGATPGSATMGSFGSFNLAPTNPLTPSDKRPNLARGESRLAHLMQKDSSEDILPKAGQPSWRSRPRTDTDPFGEETITGSAALGGGQDTSPPLNSQRRAPGLDTPVRGASSDFGMSDVPAFRDTRGQSHQTPQKRQGEREPMSPDTNPYGSPPDEHENESYDGDHLQHVRAQGLGGIPEHMSNAFGGARGFPNSGFDGSDRSQTSSVGASKGFPAALGGLPSLSNLGGMGGWPTGGNTIGTPDREHQQGFPGAFGNSLFGASGALQSPGFGAIGGVFGPGSSGSNTIGRGSKLGSLFPAAMQAQMQGPEHDSGAEGGDIRQNNAFGTIGRNAFPRETDSPMRSGRNAFEDLFPQPEESRNQTSFSSPGEAQGQGSTSLSQPSVTGASYQQSQGSSDTVSMPATQQRQMVMPDRMKWVYLDPQGQVQGPWSGLEMHDWYKASFFTADLSVRKVEDTEFEPLGQLIRRIGNSREPFLVPQIGIPHGPPTTQAGVPFTPTASGPGSSMVPVGSVQPPFAGAFPSFGTTLTAEQQNNLERRKQEEQFLMAQQREHLAAQQVKLRQMQMNPASLHHHSSAHSLQSQPSFGSMTLASPIGMAPQPPIPSASGFFDGPPRPAPNHGSTGLPQDYFREEDMNRLSIQEQQQLFGAGGTGSQGNHPQQINQLFGQHPDAQRETARLEQLHQNDPQGMARLREFEQLRAQHDLEEASLASANMPIGPPQRSHQNQDQVELQHDASAQETIETPSLTQQIQKAASSKPSPNPASQPESPWARVESGMPMPFPPPPQSTTPLPAPTAQRGRSNLPEALNVEVRSRSETPEVAASTPSVAPWAKEPAEASKGPSLKDIQEAEAKKAAKVEREAAALRRAAHEQEMKILSNQPLAPAPGLPTTSTWGSGASPSIPPTAPSPWATAAALKSQTTATTASHKKTLADIQREEELRKQKAVAAAAAAQPSLVSGGKRYADLASKPSSTGPAIGSPWATVGAGGKVKPVGKIPTGPAASVPQVIRAASSTSVATSSARSAVRPTPTARSVTTNIQSGVVTAKGEFNKWAKAALLKELRPDIDVEQFLLSISEFPEDVIAESVYGHSDSMDGRRFAAEFERRRKLADKGVIESVSSGSGTSFSTSTSGEKSSGWSEVAKKGPPKEDPLAGFKTVPNKKKGKK